jgi:hypothetical protein
MAVQWITHKGKRILYIDYSHCGTTEELLQVLDQAVEEYAKSSTNLLTISNFANTRGSEEFMKRAKELGNQVFKFKRDRSALIGLTDLQRIFLNAYNRVTGASLMAFGKYEDALEYLVE